MPHRAKWMTDEQYREKCRTDKNKQRARQRERAIAAGTVNYRVRDGLKHPLDCPCYDCLFPAKDPAVVIDADAVAWQMHRAVRA